MIRPAFPSAVRFSVLIVYSHFVCLITLHTFPQHIYLHGDLGGEEVGVCPLSL